MIGLVADQVFAEAQDELRRRSPASDRAKVAAIRHDLFRQQLEFLDDPARRKAALCGRRAGKTFSAAAYLIQTCLLKPGSNCLFLTLTKGSARGLLWRPPGTGLKHLNKVYDLGIQFHNTELIAYFPNGSLIALMGAESRDEIEKQRGQAYDLVVIDECKSFPSAVITELVREVIAPALHDRLGSLVLMGTPGSILAGVFYEVTRDGSRHSQRFAKKRRCKREWSFHRWNVRDNVAMPHIWASALKDKRAAGWADDHPIWRREYLGEWVGDFDSRVSKYDPDKNSWTPDPRSTNAHGLPDEHEWRYMCGLDFGFEDDFALVVAAHSDTCETLYHVTDFKSPHLTVSDIARKIREFETQFGGFDVIVGDSAGKAMIDALGEEYGIDVLPAEKKEKRNYIELQNSDLVGGRIRIRAGSNLETEIEVLQWNEKMTLPDRSCADHAYDAFLYLWRWAVHRFAAPAPVRPRPGTPQYDDMAADEELVRARAAAERREKLDWWEADAEQLGGFDRDDYGVELDGGSW